jgi:hypothetical protein
MFKYSTWLHAFYSSAELGLTGSNKRSANYENGGNAIHTKNLVASRLHSTGDLPERKIHVVTQITAEKSVIRKVN